MLSIDRVDMGAVDRAWRMDEPSVPEAQPLFGPSYSGLVSAFSLRPSRDATRAVFAHGYRAVTQEVTFAELDADGAMVSQAITLEVPSSSWDCLAVVPTEDAAAISLTADSEDRRQQFWLLRELNSSGELVFASQITLPTDYRALTASDGGCAVFEDADGYSVALGDGAGSRRIGRLQRDRPNELIVSESLVLPGILVGTLAGTLVFSRDEWTETSHQVRFLGLPKSGTGEPRTLAVTPATAIELYTDVQLIFAQGKSLIYGFPTRDSQVIEEVACPELF